MNSGDRQGESRVSRALAMHHNATGAVKVSAGKLFYGEEDLK